MAVNRPIDADSHVYLVDGSGYIFRAYHALPPLTRSDGTPVGAVQGFCNMLWKLLEDLKGEDEPTHLAVIFDHKGKTFRSDIFPDYKANRPPAPEDLDPEQIPHEHRALFLDTARRLVASDGDLNEDELVNLEILEQILG